MLLSHERHALGPVVENIEYITVGRQSCWPRHRLVIDAIKWANKVTLIITMLA